jgi:hypothetical protein
VKQLQPGELQTCWHRPDRGVYEIFTHPETAAEIVRQSSDGALKVNGQPSSARIVGEYGFAIQLQILPR